MTPPKTRDMDGNRRFSVTDIFIRNETEIQNRILIDHREKSESRSRQKQTESGGAPGGAPQLRFSSGSDDGRGGKRRDEDAMSSEDPFAQGEQDEDLFDELPEAGATLEDAFEEVESEKRELTLRRTHPEKQGKRELTAICEEHIIRTSKVREN